MLKINKELTSRDGSIIPSGAIVRFRTIFPESGMNVTFDLFIYRSRVDYEAGRGVVYPLEITSFGLGRPLTEEDYLSLTPHKVHEFLQAQLEGMPEIGIGNVSIVM